jgi:hypothetical protein
LIFTATLTGVPMVLNTSSQRKTSRWYAGPKKKALDCFSAG